MEIEIGDYVRTTDGEIHKVVKIKEDINDMNYYCYENNMGDFSINIVSHSKNIIDLIEEGDIVEWWYEDNYIQDFVKEFVNKELLEHLKTSKCNEDIKTILTKEQYEANCYVVEE